jgi:hypothetical protein
MSSNFRELDSYVCVFIFHGWYFLGTKAYSIFNLNLTATSLSPSSCPPPPGHFYFETIAFSQNCQVHRGGGLEPHAEMQPSEAATSPQRVGLGLGLGLVIEVSRNIGSGHSKCT